MPDINIEEKIQEAMKKKSFRENKAEYLGLSFIFCVILFITFLVGYFVPWLSLIVFLLVDIPLIMGYKHFIWFGPASAETLIEGFKVSLICGYLNFVSYMKIFFTCNIKAFLSAFLAMIGSVFVGSYVIKLSLGEQIEGIINGFGDANVSYQQLFDSISGNETLIKAIFIVEIVSIIVALLTFYFVKLNRALLPYVSFLRLTNLEGKSMSGVISHTKRILKTNRFKFYLKATVCHLFYLIPAGLCVLTYFLLSKNPVYSLTTLDLVSAVVFFITLFPAILFVELNNRNFCIDANQEYLKEHKKMLNDAISDLNKTDKR